MVIFYNSDFFPTVQTLGNTSLILTFSKSFPTVLSSKSDEAQLRHDSHSHLVTAVTNIANNTIVASGDEGSNIHIWEFHSNLLLSRIKGSVPGGPLKLTFSENERLLAGLFLDKNSYYISLFDIHQARELSTVCLGMGNIRSIMFKKKLDIVSLGENHLVLWTYVHGNLIGDSIPFNEFSTDLYCQVMNKLDMIIGTGEGKIQVLREQLHSDKKLGNNPKEKILCLAVSNL